MFMTKVYVNDFNPYKDGINNDASSINEAIIKCHELGGGEVIFNGIYKSSTIKLLDNVILNISDSKIILSDDLSSFYDINIDRKTDLSKPAYEACDYDGRPSKFFIYGHDLKNIGIIGNGVIDGNEHIFYGEKNEHYIEGSFYPRIPLIYFEACNNLKLYDITLEKSAFWTIHLVGCNDVHINKITINNNLKMVNCDGIDPDHCKNVVIENSNITSADDCIVFKCTEAFRKYKDTSNIVVKNCKLTSTSAAIKFGTESVCDISNIKIENILITNSNRGISLQLRDEGNIHNIEFKNIEINTKRVSPIYWWGKSEPIAITAVKRKHDSIIGSIYNIKFYDIKASSENGILIFGENNINDILIDNIDLKITSKTAWDKKYIDLRPSEDYGLMEGILNAIYIKNANNIIINNYNFIKDNNINDILFKEFEIDGKNIDINTKKDYNSNILKQ